MDESVWTGSNGTKLLELVGSIGTVVRSVASQLVGDTYGRGGKGRVRALKVMQTAAGRSEGGTSSPIRK